MKNNKKKNDDHRFIQACDWQDKYLGCITHHPLKNIYIQNDIFFYRNIVNLVQEIYI